MRNNAYVIAVESERFPFEKSLDGLIMKVLCYSVFPRRWLLSCRGEWEETFKYSLPLSRKQLQDCPPLERAVPLLSWHLLTASV